jgi:hypothetical protein
MGANDVTFTFSAKDRNFIETFLQVRDAIDKGGVALDNFGKRGQEVDKTFGSAISKIGQATLQFVGVGTVLGTIATAAGVLRGEMEQFVRIRGQASEKVISIGQARQQALWAAGMSTAEAKPHQGTIDEIIRQAGSAEFGWSAFGEAQSARGEFSAEYAGQAALAATRVTGRGGNEEVIRRAPGATLDLARALPRKADGSPQDPEEVFGRVLAINPISRVGDFSDVVHNQMPVIAQLLMHHRATPDEALGLTGAMSELAVDEQGRRSSQAAINLAGRLQEAATEHPLLAYDEAFQSQWKKMQLGQRIEFLRSGTQNAQMMRAYLLGAQASNDEDRQMALAFKWGGSLKGELKTLAPQRAIIDPGADPRAYALYKESIERAAQLSGEDAKAKYEDYSKIGRESGALDKITELDRVTKGNLAVMQSRKTDLAAAGKFLETVQKLADTEGDTALGTKLEKLKAMVSAGKAPLPEQVKNIGSLLDARANLLINGDPTFKSDSYLKNQRRKFEAWAAERGRSNELDWPASREQTWRDYRLETMAPEELEKLQQLQQFKSGLRMIEPSLPNASRREGMMEGLLWDSSDSPTWELELRRRQQLEQMKPYLKPHSGGPSKPGLDDQSAVRGGASAELLAAMQQQNETLAQILTAIENGGGSQLDVMIDDNRGRAYLRQRAERPLPLESLSSIG